VVNAHRRVPTPAEVQEINEKLRVLEESQKARPEGHLPAGPTPAP
jgi:hypothetical protein